MDEPQQLFEDIKAYRICPKSENFLMENKLYFFFAEIVHLYTIYLKVQNLNKGSSVKNWIFSLIR